MFQARPTDERYVTGGGGGGSGQCDTLWQGGRGGVKIGQKKRYVIVERPLCGSLYMHQPSRQK